MMKPSPKSREEKPPPRPAAPAAISPSTLATFKSMFGCAS